jgi:hypothetical protein
MRRLNTICLAMEFGISRGCNKPTVSQTARFILGSPPRCAIILLFWLVSTGCLANPAGQGPVGAERYTHCDLGSLTNQAIDLLLKVSPEVTPGDRLGVASVSAAPDVDSPSAFGTVVTDMVRMRLARDGHPVSDIRLGKAVSLTKGERLLGSDSDALALAHHATAIVTGTYSTKSDKVYVSLKLLSATDAHTIADADIVVPLREVQGLLNQRGH